MSWLERVVTGFITLFVLALLGFLGAALFAHATVTDSTFHRACAASGGTAVWDTRQYQCLKGAHP